MAGPVAAGGAGLGRGRRLVAGCCRGGRGFGNGGSGQRGGRQQRGETPVLAAPPQQAGGAAERSRDPPGVRAA